MGALRDILGTLRDMGVRVVTLSGDSPERLRDLAENSDPEYEMLSDIELAATKAFGLAFHVSDDYRQRLEKSPLDITGNSISTEQILPVPAVYVVDAYGNITFSYVNPDHRVRCDPKVVLAAAAAVVPAEKD